MKDKDFEMYILDLQSGEKLSAKDLETKRVFIKQDLEKAYQAGFDFEEASFEEWYNKTYKNGTG